MNNYGSRFLVSLCVVPVPGHLARVLADSQPAGFWSGSPQHTHNSLDLDQHCPAGPFLVPVATPNISRQCKSAVVSCLLTLDEKTRL